MDTLPDAVTTLHKSALPFLRWLHPGLPHGAVKYLPPLDGHLSHTLGLPLDSESHSETLGFLLESEFVKIPQKSHRELTVSQFEIACVGAKETRHRSCCHCHLGLRGSGVFSL